MPNEFDLLRRQLLGQLPDPASIARYRESVTRSLEKNSRHIRRERLLVTLFWIFCVASAVAWLWFSPDMARVPRTPFLACIFFLWGGIELIKHYINACRVDLMKEIKQLQAQVFDLEIAVSQSSARGTKA